MNEEPKAGSSNYTPSPEIPQELAPRLALILEVLSGAKSLSEAAREANLSRNHFQSLLNRSLGSMVQALTPQEPGRKPKPQALERAGAAVEAGSSGRTLVSKNAWRRPMSSSWSPANCCTASDSRGNARAARARVASRTMRSLSPASTSSIGWIACTG